MPTLPKVTTLAPEPPTANPRDLPTPALPPAVAAILGMVHLDAELRVVEANDTFCEQFRLTPAEVRGVSLSRFFHPTGRSSLQEQFSRLVAGQLGDFSAPMTLVDGNLRDRDCLVTGIALNRVPHVYCTTECVAVALVVPDTVHSPPLTLAAAPAALAEVPSRVLEGVAAGLSTQQLATRLGLSSHGVEYHISVMLKKLKAPNRSALVARAYALDILVAHCWPPRVRPQYMARFQVGTSACATEAPVPADRAPAAATHRSDDLTEVGRLAPVSADDTDSRPEREHA
ncbi:MULTISPECIES: LuxR C-terminal-related transcriptional regulator [Streptomyces]|uniref:LuxR C-terminal-related transcriptional regulator n=2 Tax=Streptomyces griseiscabiei TaxID=2993540 RepID=A0ABU4LCX6_9ACTN|nr:MULTISPECIES: LuxR C-terminal-related transcriptional regulator [Streptomyces]MBZ3900163.1 PAS domain-containing protein [Streptomyces griseiscabiei]MDX2913170.1 LuxR C-terminal-related transcriptional regulator [Streptomyces griseiscabiei]